MTAVVDTAPLLCHDPFRQTRSSMFRGHWQYTWHVTASLQRSKPKRFEQLHQATSRDVRYQRSYRLGFTHSTPTSVIRQIFPCVTDEFSVDGLEFKNVWAQLCWNGPVDSLLVDGCRDLMNSSAAHGHSLNMSYPAIELSSTPDHSDTTAHCSGRH